MFRHIRMKFLLFSILKTWRTRNRGIRDWLQQLSARMPLWLLRRPHQRVQLLRLLHRPLPETHQRPSSTASTSTSKSPASTTRNSPAHTRSKTPPPSLVCLLADGRVTPRRGEPPWLPGQNRYAHHRSASSQLCSSPPVSSQLCLAVATPLPRSGPGPLPQLDVLEPTALLKC